MKIKILNSKKIHFNCLEDLNKVIPEGMPGRAVNFGQGEGQVEILNTVWGFYVGSDNNYYMQYEEGIESWEKIQCLVTLICSKICKEFEIEMQLELEGPHTNVPSV